MTETEKSKYIEFLRHKVRAFREYIGHPKSPDSNDKVLARFESLPASELKFIWFKSFDSDLELFCRKAVGGETFDQVIEEVRSKFGFGRIALDPEIVLRRIIKRGKITNDAELRFALEYLSDGNYLDTENEHIIANLASKYQKLS